MGQPNPIFSLILAIESKVVYRTTLAKSTQPKIIGYPTFYSKLLKF